MRILVIDDSDAIREALRASIQYLGHQFIPASNGEEGIKIVEANKDIDLVLIDRQMPRILGEAVVRQVRGLRPHIKIVLMSGNLDESIRKVALAAGANRVVEKPFSLENLLQELFPKKKGGEK
ncbi:MAG: response regulator [Candidatus Portnoybacteria bacterium]|nr:response regulator [Candidatus Portnoybacteria bacterium]